jgi:crotonobetainyl-CoA:carnitine CoA-transferase CaiB-like acyl-CoA transferase
VMDRWGNDWATIHKINPRLIYCRLSGYGDTGPRQIRRSYGRIAEAWAGWAYINGHEDGPALHSGFSWGDTLQSIWAANAIVMALYWRDVQGGGEGQLIDSGLVEPLYRAIEQQIIIRDQNNVSIKRFGTQHEGTPYAGISQTKDGRWFSWSAFSAELAGNLLKAVGLSDDARFNTLDKALGYRKEFQAAVTDWMKARTLEEIWSEFEKHQAAGAPVMSGEDLYNDAHIKARDMLVTMPDPEGGKDIVQQGVVPKLSETPGRIQNVSHPIGYHNEEVFCGMLGLSRAELQRLDELGVTQSSKGAL